MRTSQSHPIRVDWLIRDDDAHPWNLRDWNLRDSQAPARGRLGLTFLPGKRCPGRSATWRRDLGADLDHLRAMGVTDIVCLVPEDELRRCAVPNYQAEVLRRQMGWTSGPFADAGVPSDLPATVRFAADLADRINGGARVVVHCRGGLGRAGLVGACTLLAIGRCVETPCASAAMAPPAT